MSQNNHWEESRKQYHPTLICVPATEWEQMNEEIAQLRATNKHLDKRAEDAELLMDFYKYSHEAFGGIKMDHDILVKLQRETKEYWAARKKPYAFQMQNKHDQTVAVDIGGKVPVVMPESMYRKMQKMEDGSTTTMPEVDEKGQMEDPTATNSDTWFMDQIAKTDSNASKEYNTDYRDNDRRFLILKYAVESGKTIMDDKGSEVFYNGYYNFSTKGGMITMAAGWESVWRQMVQTKDWHIKPEAPNYPLLLAELGMGKMLRSEDGYDLSWSRYTDRLTLYKGGIPTGVYTWNDIVEQVLEKHSGWRVV